MFGKPKEILIKHPSYGYATPAQIEKLKTMSPGVEKNALLETIKKQTGKKGKI